MLLKSLQLLLGLILAISSMPALTQTAYLRSTEPCQVAAYTSPDSKPLASKLSCDEKVTVLERQGGYVRIRTSNDRVIWVDDVSTTTELPASLEIQRLMEYQEKIEEELEYLKSQVDKLSKQSEKLIEALLATRADQDKKSTAK